MAEQTRQVNTKMAPEVDVLVTELANLRHAGNRSDAVRAAVRLYARVVLSQAGEPMPANSQFGPDYALFQAVHALRCKVLAAQNVLPRAVVEGLEERCDGA